VGYVYLDEFAASVINSFAYRVYGHGVPLLSAEYDRAMVTYVCKSLGIGPRT